MVADGPEENLDNQTIYNIVLFYSSISQRSFHLSALVALVAVLKVTDRDTYEKLAKGVAGDYATLIDKLRASTDIDYIRNWLLVSLEKDALLDKSKERLLETAQQISASVHLKRSQFIPYHCSRMDYFTS